MFFKFHIKSCAIVKKRLYIPAFTLIELLVTLSIASILIAILLPAFRYAKEQSRLLVCSSNLRQNYLFLSAYANDFNGYWPKTDSSIHTNQFYKINSQSANGPLYYLWLSGFVSQPRTWYCPSSHDLFENNWQTGSNGKLQPNEKTASSGYQYRMYFAYNWPDVKTTASKIRQSPQLIGHIKPSQHRNLALLVDGFNYAKSGTITNHRILKRSNVLFNDSSIAKRLDGGNIQKLDLSWSQAGDWRIQLADGTPDNKHNAAILWRFFDTGNWQPATTSSQKNLLPIYSE